MTAMRPGLPAPLIDLLGARWAMGPAVAGAAWFGTDNAVAFGLADGTVAIARAGWEGAATLQPREGGGVELVPATAPAPPVMRAGVHAGPCLDLVAAGDGTVLSGGVDGQLACTGADGGVETLASFPGARVERVAAGKGGARACAVGQRVHRFGPSPGVLDLPSPAAALAFDPAGRQLAIASTDGVTLWSAEASLLASASTPRALAWSPDGRVLVSGLADNAAHGWRLPDGDAIVLDGYPGQPLSLSFSEPGGFLATSGSARVVCWQLGGAPRRSECGVGSTVAVTQVACHPVRPLIAAGYENGAVLLCRPDSADILFVRAPGAAAVSTLAWSPDGAFLALGAAGGEIGVVAFPERLFRPIAAGSATQGGPGR